jgi:hypothetical protein
MSDESASAPAASEGAAATTTTQPAGLSASLATDTQSARPVASETATATEPAKSWYDDHIKDAQLKEWVGKKGWKDVENVVKSAYNLEKIKGISDDKIVRLPEPGNAEAQAEFFNKLGRPETPEGYAEKTDGLDKDFLKVAHENGITKAQFETLVKYDQARVEKFKAAAEEQFAAKSAADVEALKSEWGGRFDELQEVAKRAVRKFELGDMLPQIERAVGTKAMMQMLHKLGQSTGEARFVDAERQSSASFGMSPEQAAREITALSSTKGTFDRLKNDAAFKDHWTNLHKIKNGVK